MPHYDNCKDLFAALSQYIDAELPTGDCAAIEAHIAGCAPCVQFVESLKRTVDLVKATGAPPAYPPIPDEVREKLREAYLQAKQDGNR